LNTLFKYGVYWNAMFLAFQLHLNCDLVLWLFVNIKMIMHTYCALHKCHELIVVLFRFLFFSVDRGSEVDPFLFEEQDPTPDEQGKHNLLSAHIRFRSISLLYLHTIPMYFGHQVEFSYLMH